MKGKRKRGFGLYFLVFPVAGVRKERRSGLKPGLSWSAPAIPEQAQEGVVWGRGRGGIWRRLHDWSQAVRKRNWDQRPKGRSRERASSPEGRVEVEVQGAHGLSWN